MKFFCIVLLAACGLAASEKRECRTGFGMNPFDVQRFSGDWYGVSLGRPLHQRPELTCLKYHYNATGEGAETRVDISMVFKLLRVIQEDTGFYRMKCRPYIPGVNSVLQAAVFESPVSEFPLPAVFSVIGTDYDNFAVVHTCYETYHQAEDRFERTPNYIIWSRNKTLDATILSTLHTLGRGYEPDVVADMQMIDLSGC